MYNVEVPLRTVVYIRKSSNDKDENHQTLSFPRQKRDIQEFLKRHNSAVPPAERLWIVDEARDIVIEDASAKKPNNRPEFTKMIERIHRRKYDVLLCTDLSRLSRNAVDTATLVQLLEDKQIGRIMTLDKLFKTTPTDIFTLSLFLSVAKFENDQRAMNTKSGIANQKKAGVTTHATSMGYINVGEKKGKKTVIPDDLTWDDVRALWEMMITGEYRMSDTIAEGISRNVTYVRKGERRTPGSTAYRYMFRNRYYTGKVALRDAETGEEKWINGNHLPMVTDEEFEKVQIVLQNQGYKHCRLTKAPSIETILNEILICGKCQTGSKGNSHPTKMTFEQKTRLTCARCKHRYSAPTPKPCPACGEPVSGKTKSETRRYYHCCKKISSKVCSHDFYGKGKPTKNLQADAIESFLDKNISSLHISDGLFTLLSRQLYTLWLKAHEKLRRKEKAIEEQKAALREERLNYRKKSLEKEMDDVEREDIDVLIDINKQKVEALEEEETELQEEEEEQFEKSWQALNALREAKSVLKTPDIGIEPIRKLVLSMVSNLTITDNKWIINWKEPFAAIQKASIASNSITRSATRRGELNYSWLPLLEHMRTDWAQEIIELGRELEPLISSIPFPLIQTFLVQERIV